MMFLSIPLLKINKNIYLVNKLGNQVWDPTVLKKKGGVGRGGRNHFFSFIIHFCHKVFSTKHRTLFLERENDWVTGWWLTQWSGS